MLLAPPRVFSSSPNPPSLGSFSGASSPYQGPLRITPNPSQGRPNSFSRPPLALRGPPPPQLPPPGSGPGPGPGRASSSRRPPTWPVQHSTCLWCCVVEGGGPLDWSLGAPGVEGRCSPPSPPINTALRNTPSSASHSTHQHRSFTRQHVRNTIKKKTQHRGSHPSVDHNTTVPPFSQWCII